MRSHEPDPTRRRLLQSGLAAGAAALGARVPIAAEPAPPKRPAERGIPSRPFGRTGRTLPILGMGGSAMVQRWAPAYGVTLPSLEERAAMVRHAYEAGIRYFDTARAYDESEGIVGRGLKGLRDQVYLATKVHSPAGMVRQSLETSLKNLDTSYVDCAQVHSPLIEMVGFEGAMKVHEELLKLRGEGMLRFIGLTTHVAFETVLRMIETGGFDQVLLAYGYFRKGLDTLHSNRTLEYRERCLAAAHQRRMAIVAMKVMGATIFGHNARNLVPNHDPASLEKLPAAAIRWVLQDERVSMLNIGVSVPSDIDRNVAMLRSDWTFTPEDRRLLAEFSARAYETDTIKNLRVV